MTSSGDLALRMFLRDLRSAHRRSLLGYVWIVLPPVVMASVWVFLDNTGVVSTAHGQVSYALFAFIGTSLWQGFLDGLNVPFLKLDLAQGLITKYSVPPEALVSAGLVEVLFNQVVRMMLVAGFYVLADVDLQATAVFVPVGAALLVFLGFELGSFLAPFAALYKDIHRGVLLASTVIFFVTPIVYAAEPSGAVSFTNPVAVLITTSRDWMLAGETVAPGAAAAWALVTVALLPVTFGVYRLLTPHLVDRATV